MKTLFLTCGLTFLAFSFMANAQTIDTTVIVGNQLKLHFTIIKGKRPPILFESGAGNNGNIWNIITPQIADITGATVITYNRLGFGENSQSSPIGFGNEMLALEEGLQKLGYAHSDIMLVAHSMGGMYQSYYASRHAAEVKAAVFIETASAATMSAYLNNPAFVARDNNVVKDIAAMRDTVLNHPMPLNIPLIDIVAEHQLDDNGNLDTVNDNMWLGCHKAFVEASPVRKSLTAFGTGHHVFIDNPLLVINVIVNQYATFLVPSVKAGIMEKAYLQTADALNEMKRNEVKCGHSEDDLNQWGYALLGKREYRKAIEVFKLNVSLFPDSWNTYDSLGEAYLKSGHIIQASKNYKKSAALKPKK